MHGDLLVYARRLIYGSLQLCHCVLIGGREYAVVDRIVTGLVDLDEVCALFELLTDSLNDLSTLLA